MALNSEESKAKQLLQEFIRETVPEYIIDGAHSIVAQDGVQKIDVKKREHYWDVEGQVQGKISKSTPPRSA